MKSIVRVALTISAAAGLLSSAHAKEPGKPGTCSPSGEWLLKVAPVAEGSKCVKAKSARKASDERFTIVAKTNGSLEVRSAGPLVEDDHIKSTVNSLGGCSLHYEFTENIVPWGSPLYEHVEYELLEKDSVVSGLMVSSTLADMPGSASVCSETSIVVGSKKPLSTADLTIDQAKAPGEFAAYYKRIMKQACQLPVDSVKKREVVAVRLVVGRAGELKNLWIDGVDQRITENCAAVVSEGRAPILSNPTGKDQKIEFGVRLP